MTTRDAIWKRIEELEEFFDNYDKKGKTFRQFWEEAESRIESVRADAVATGDNELMQRLNFTMSAADQNGLLYSQDSLDRLITEGPSALDLSAEA